MKRYLTEHVDVHNKPSTAKEIRRMADTKILPKLGRHRVDGLTRAQIRAWHYEMRETPYEANRALAALSKALSLAVSEWEMRADNPCRGLKRFAEHKRERFFSHAELQAIGEAVSDMEREGRASSTSILALRLLALTGMRLGEVLGLKWEHVDLAEGVIRLSDAKAGARTVPLGAPALARLGALPRDGKYIVFGDTADEPLKVRVFRAFWDKVRERAALGDARPHDFRHTAGTYAAQAGFNAFMIRDFMGHKTLAMTGRYVERAADPVRATADAVAGRVATALEGRTALTVPLQSQHPSSNAA
jgi:integrase